MPGWVAIIASLIALAIICSVIIIVCIWWTHKYR